MNKITSFITGRRRTRSSTSEASTSSSRRHSVAESPRDMDIEEDHPAPRGDMLLLGGMTNPRSASMRFTEGVPPPPRRTTRSSAPPPYKPKKCSYGFTVTSKEEEERLKLMKGRLRPNFDFDEDDMEKLGFHHDIHKLLDNIGWRYFSDGVSVDMQEDIAMEMFMTMKTIMKEVDGEEEAYLKFRLKDEDKEISYTTIGNLLGFRSDANESVQVAAGELDSFWERIAKDVNRQR